MNTINLFLQLFLIQILCSPEALQSTTSTKRYVGEYDGIIVAGSYEVTLVGGDEGQITLYGAEKDLELTETEIKNNALIIKTKKTSWYKSWRIGKVKITVPVQKISKLTMTGSGSIQNDFQIKTNRIKTAVSGSGSIRSFLDVNYFDSVITGSGHIDVNGTANESSIRITGSGDFDGESLISNLLKVSITGSGGAKVHTKDALEAVITGSGNVRCYGNPQKQNTKVTGSGKITIKS